MPKQGHSQTFVWKGGPFLQSTPGMLNLEGRKSGGMLPQGNFLKMNAQKAEVSNFSVTK